MRLLFSVVIPTAQRPLLLERCLNSLLLQQLSADHFEIIVVDDGRDHGTQQIVNNFISRKTHRISLIATQGRQGPAVARNKGWKKAWGEIIAFTDDDCIVSPEWLKSASVYFKRKDLMGLSGRIIVPIRPIPTDYELSTSWLADAPFVTANCFYKKEILNSTGGFDERFTTAWREDTDLYFTLKERGALTEMASNVVVTHPVRKAPWLISVKEQRKSLFNALLYKKHPQLFKQIVERRPFLAYYLIAISFFTFIYALYSGNDILVKGSTLIWLIFTIRFALMRLRKTSHDPSHVIEMFLSSMIIPIIAIYWRITGAIKYRSFYW